MGSNIIELAKLGHERAAELKASCCAVDVRSLAQLISDLASQLEVQLVRGNEQAVQLANAESKCMELAAENVTLNDKMNRLATWPGIEFYSSAWEFCNLDGNDALEFMCDVKTPATDAFLAEVRASGVEMYADNLDSSADDAERDGFDDAVKFLRSESSGVRLFAAQLRKGAAL
ncbi:hypothetical protein XS22_001887 [Salmonella enterica subsp. enterica]|nr:hypothetical protein [Salmonella enterica subsp. enterica serovar Poona]